MGFNRFVCFDLYYEFFCIWEYLYKYYSRFFNEFCIFFYSVYTIRTRLLALGKKKSFMVSNLLSFSRFFILLRYNVFGYFKYFVTKSYRTYMKHKIYRAFYYINFILIDFSFLIFFDFLRLVTFLRTCKLNQILISFFSYDFLKKELIWFCYHDILYRLKLINRFSNKINIFSGSIQHKIPFNFFIYSKLFDFYGFFFSLVGVNFFSYSNFNRLERFFIRLA